MSFRQHSSSVSNSYIDRWRPATTPQQAPGGLAKCEAPKAKVWETREEEEAKDHHREGGSAGFNFEGT